MLNLWMLGLLRLKMRIEIEIVVPVNDLGPSVLLCRYRSRLLVDCWLVTRWRSTRFRHVCRM
jgi:hypothetical protein